MIIFMSYLLLSNQMFDNNNIKYDTRQHPIVKFLNEDIWEVNQLTKKCLEYPNASLCTFADPLRKVPIVFVVFKIRF